VSQNFILFLKDITKENINITTYVDGVYLYLHLYIYIY